MQLFEFNEETGLPEFDPIVFELAPIRHIAKRDRSKYKEQAKKEIAYIWFFADYKSDFFGEPNEDKKVKEIKALLDFDEKWKPDKKIKEAIEFYRELTRTPTTILLEQTRASIVKLSEFLDSIDYKATDNRGQPIYDIVKVVQTTNQIPKLLSTLKQIEEKVKEEQDQLEKTIRGDKEIATWEDGDIEAI